MRIAVFCCAISVATLGCSHKHYLDPSNVDELLALNERASQDVCGVRTVEGDLVKARDLKLSADSTRWVAAGTGEVVQIPTNEIDYISFVDRGAGAVDGAGVGFAIGALFGGLLGFISGNDEASNTEYGDYRRSEGAFLGALVFGIPSAVVGAIVGTAGGSRDFYYPALSDSLSGPVSGLSDLPQQDGTR
jgi:hypothetical protein